MRFRKLRIAWSVGCVIACALLIVLWVRSYWWIDLVWVGRRFYLVCGWGNCYYMPIMYFDNQFATHVSEHHFGLFYFSSYWNGDGPHVSKMVGYAVPIWALLLAVAALAAGPWFRWAKRFSLRTLLIATTLVAVVLGLIVWLR